MKHLKITTGVLNKKKTLCRWGFEYFDSKISPNEMSEYDTN